MGEKGEKKKVKISIGPGFLGCLCLMFTWMKLTGRIDWSWWLVMSPIWGPVALVLAVIVAIAVLVGVALAIAWSIDHIIRFWRNFKRKREIKQTKTDKNEQIIEGAFQEIETVVRQFWRPWPTNKQQASEIMQQEIKQLPTTPRVPSESVQQQTYNKQASESPPKPKRKLPFIEKFGALGRRNLE
jgi:hypothetical protein